ncbi:MAG: phenylacetate--CoA ligase family protein [Acidobacteriota bacterium]
MHLKRSLYRLGMYARNHGRITANHHFLRSSEDWTLEQLRTHQFTALRRLVQAAYDHTPFYRARLDEAGVHPRDLKSLDDLPRFPTVTKADLLRHGPQIQLHPRGERLFYTETSGSTGEPLIFYRDREWDAWHRASILRGYSWYGIHPWDRNGYLWGFNLAPAQRIKTRVLDALQNRFRLFSYDDAEIDLFARKLRHAVYLGGYSSMVYEIARRLAPDHDQEPPYPLRLVKGTSEKIWPAYQDAVKRAFGTRMVSEYGAAECGIIAFECPEGRMHVNMETVVVETIHDEIVVTNLVSRSFPIIRYRLGDYVEMDRTSSCECGRAHIVLNAVTGRVGAVIQGKTGSYPSLTLYYVFKNLASGRGLVVNYQAIQSIAGELDLRVDGSVTEKEERLILREFTKYFGTDVTCHVVPNSDLRSTTHKKQDFVSRL